MALVDSRGFNLNPSFRVAGGGANFANQLQQFGQRNIVQGKKEEIRNILSQQQGAQPEQPQMQTDASGQVIPQTAPVGLTLEQKKEAALSIDPALAQKMFKDAGIDDASQRSEASRFAAQLETTPFAERSGLINARIQKLQSEGRNYDATSKLLGATEEEQNQAALGIQLADLSTKERTGLKAQHARGRSATQKAFAPITIVNDKGEKRLVSPTVDNLTGEAKLAPFSVPEGFRISEETDEEKRAANVLAEGQKAKQKVQAKGQAQRQQLSIDRGLDAADGFANIQRAIDLLDQVETGGIDAVSLRAQQIFGIEGADQAELSNRMGKAVLSQLRATFGAAFTAKEGDSLARIEAGFGKSTEGNRRLLEQTKRIILRAAKRGIRAAREQGDTATMRDIQEALKFRLGEAPASEAAITEPQAAPANQDQEALNWAKQNPNDPRAKQIMQIQGAN